MTQQPILGCALNLSEGRRLEVIELAAVQAASAAQVLDISSDTDHNRTVLTLAGYPQRLVEAVVRVARIAVEHMDLGNHSGVHPRLGVVDVVPFYPLRNAPMAAAVGAARSGARRMWEELLLPVFLYEEAAATDQARALPWIRRYAFAGHQPDFGGPGPHPTAGAAVVGARGLLVAYNVDLATHDPRVAQSIAATLRRDHAGHLRTLGLYLPSRDTAQVSMNITRPDTFTLRDAYQAVSGAAGKAGIKVQGSEIVGLVPRACLSTATSDELGLRAPPKVLEEAVDRLYAD